MSKFFINRPIFAIVIAIMITLIGLLSMVNLPVARYPQISPPSVRVSTMYTGATPQVLNDTVASVIESQIVGVQDLDYMTSDSASTGTYSLSLQFNQGSDPDMDTVNTQNRVQAALAQLPSEVQQVGVTTTKSSGDMAYIFSLNSPNGTFDSTFLKNYGTNYLMDAIKGVKGVGSVQEFGSDYAMRIWLDPSKMQKLDVTLFSDLYRQVGQEIKEGAFYYIKGKIQSRDGRLQMIAQEIREAVAERFWIQVKNHELDQEISRILEQYKGPIPVIIRYEEERKTIISPQHFVAKSDELEAKLGGIVMKTIYR